MPRDNNSGSSSASFNGAKKLRISGFDFEVMWEPELQETECQGEISYRRQQIRLCSSLLDHDGRAKWTLLHEIVEAAINYAEIKMEHTDLTRLATYLYSILADNGLEKLEAGLPARPALVAPTRIDGPPVTDHILCCDQQEREVKEGKEGVNLSRLPARLMPWQTAGVDILSGEDQDTDELITYDHLLPRCQTEREDTIYDPIFESIANEAARIRQDTPVFSLMSEAAKVKGELK